MLLDAWRLVDRALRGDLMCGPVMGKGGPEVPAGRLGLALVPLAMAYGACMGSFALWGDGGAEYRQVVASALKVPLLFALTLLVTFPSLLVFSTLAGSPLRVGSLFRLLMIGLTVAVAILASLGPIVAFFGLSSSSHGFLVLLNLGAFGVSAVMGLNLFLRAWRMALEYGVGGDPEAAEEGDPRAIERDERLARERATRVVRVWVLVVLGVGLQMAWLLRPLVGEPGEPFLWLSPRGTNAFFEFVQMLRG